MFYYPGVSVTPLSIVSGAETTQFTGTSTVSYQLRDATGTPTGATLTGVQVSQTEIQPDGWSTGDPLVIIGAGPGEAANVSASAGSAPDLYVDETGDTMTGTLNMSGNEIDNARLDAGQF